MNVELKERELLANQLERAFFQTFVECEDVNSYDDEKPVYIGKLEY